MSKHEEVDVESQNNEHEVVRKKRRHGHAELEDFISTTLTVDVAGSATVMGIPFVPLSGTTNKLTVARYHYHYKEF